MPEPTILVLLVHWKNGFVTATKLGATNKFFVAATKNFAAATKRFVDITKHFVVLAKYFCYPYFNKWFCWYNKNLFLPCITSMKRGGIGFQGRLINSRINLKGRERGFVLIWLSIHYLDNNPNWLTLVISDLPSYPKLVSVYSNMSSSTKYLA